MKVRIVGMKFFVGMVDGNNIKSGKLYTECKLDDSRNEGDRQFAKGMFTEEWRVPVDLVKRLAAAKLPCDAILETERVGNGKEAREVIVDLRLVDADGVIQQGASVKAAARV